MDEEALLAGFEACTLPREQWTHRAHLTVAYLYLRQYPFAEALERIRARIQAYNASHHVPEGPLMGYNETMTQAWLRIVHATLCEQGPRATAAEFLDEHPHLTQRTLLRLYYSRDIWTTRDCKQTFVEPDLAPLPTPRDVS
jgi:hypothetical protein